MKDWIWSPVHYRLLLCRVIYEQFILSLPNVHCLQTENQLKVCHWERMNSAELHKWWRRSYYTKWYWRSGLMPRNLFSLQCWTSRTNAEIKCILLKTVNTQWLHLNRKHQHFNQCISSMENIIVLDDFILNGEYYQICILNSNTFNKVQSQLVFTSLLSMSIANDIRYQKMKTNWANLMSVAVQRLGETTYIVYLQIIYSFIYIYFHVQIVPLNCIHKCFTHLWVISIKHQWIG